ncbi:Thiosulfate-binding protein [Serratia symbiotica]|nr:Thiosulfate-binding protein [Serratia symbiotica]
MKQTAAKHIILKRWLASALLASCSASSAELLNSSYDISRELFTALNSGFEQQWAQQHPHEKLTIKQSHAGSSKQALAILQGLRADVVTYNQVSDVQILHDRGQLLSASWQSRLPNNSSPFYSTMAFLVRKGNPKRIQTWHDLVRDDVKLVFPNPKTSGNGRYTYLAAWVAASQADGNDQVETRAFMTRLLKNVVVFDTGGRGATTTFVERGLGDVLISFESEVNNIRQQYGKDKYDVIVPTVNILAEFPVAWLDKNIERNGNTQVAKDYLHYLYSSESQKLIAQFYYRVYDEAVMVASKWQFPYTRLFRVEDQFGGWPAVMKTHFSAGAELDQLLSAGHK